MTTQITYETGATSHAVNDLVLFTDNTRELAEHRDFIYKKLIEFEKQDTRTGLTKEIINKNNKRYLQGKFVEFLHEVIRRYNNEMGKTYSFYLDTKIHTLTIKEKNEFGRLYANDFENWKKENQL